MLSWKIITAIRMLPIYTKTLSVQYASTGVKLAKLLIFFILRSIYQVNLKEDISIHGNNDFASRLI